MMKRRTSKVGCFLFQGTPKGQLAKKREAFSLVEMLIAIAIVIILVALSLGALKGALERSAQAKCMGQLRQIGGAFFTYAADNNGKFPQAFVGAGNSGNEFWSHFLSPYLGLKETDTIGITTMKCPTKSKYTNSMYAVNYVAIIGVDPGQTGSAWLETGSKRLASEMDPKAFLVADGFGAFVYTPTIWGLTRDEDGDGIADSNPVHPFNGLDFRHNRRANFFLLNGGIVSLTSAEWATNKENIWGKER